MFFIFFNLYIKKLTAKDSYFLLKYISYFYLKNTIFVQCQHGFKLYIRRVNILSRYLYLGQIECIIITIYEHFEMLLTFLCKNRDHHTLEILIRLLEKDSIFDAAVGRHETVPRP